jgi:hypothetical protein
MTEKQRLATAVLRHLTNTEVFSYPVRGNNICACLRAIELAEAGRLHDAVKLPSGYIVTAGRVIEMFRLEQHVNWEKAAKQKMSYDDMRALGIEPERRKLYTHRAEVVVDRRRTPRAGHE